MLGDIAQHNDYERCSTQPSHFFQTAIDSKRQKVWRVLTRAMYVHTLPKSNICLASGYCANRRSLPTYSRKVSKVVTFGVYACSRAKKDLQHRVSANGFVDGEGGRLRLLFEQSSTSSLPVRCDFGEIVLVAYMACTVATIATIGTMVGKRRRTSMHLCAHLRRR